MSEKTCTKCKRTLPATLEYFYIDKRRNQFMARCKECHLAQKREHYKKPEVKEYTKQQTRKWQSENKKKWYAIKKAWRQCNPNTVLKMKRDYRKNHIELVRKRARDKYYLTFEKTKDKRRKYNREWAKNHREYTRANSKKRRSATRAAPGKFTANDILAQYKHQKGLCYYCNKPTGKSYHIDHVIPISRGGSNDLSNIVIACAQCNMRKHNKLPHEWKESSRLL